MINFNTTQAKVTAAIKKFNYQVTLVKADDTTAKAYAVWDSNTKNNPNLTANNKQIYIVGNIKKEPKPDDYIKYGSDQWLIKEVEAYRPTTVTLAYRVVVE